MTLTLLEDPCAPDEKEQDKNGRDTDLAPNNPNGSVIAAIVLLPLDCTLPFPIFFKTSALGLVSMRPLQLNSGPFCCYVTIDVSCMIGGQQ